MATRRVRYVPHNGAAPKKDNPFPGMKAMLISDQARDPAVKAGHDIAKLAREYTPEGKEGPPHMRDEYKVNEHTAPVKIGKHRNARVGCEVYNDVTKPDQDHSYAAAAEFGVGFAGGKGAGQTRGHRALGRAGAAIGEWHGDL